ncbi:MAG: phosphoglucosamine mutase [Candidatus Margulisiibacteriota bacterium]
MSLKISISGVRGLVPETLTPEVCLDFAKAFGTYLSEKNPQSIPKIVVGTDPRSSSESIKEIVFSGLLYAGCKIVDLGICPTPTVGIMLRELEASGGMIITASHNPLPWNGLKFLRGDGIFLNEAQAQNLIDIYNAKTFKKGKAGKLASNSSAIDTHIKNILKTINPRSIRLKKIKVAVDCCNGAGSKASLKLLEKLGCQIEAINCNPSLPFPHPPEPLAENLGDLSKLVISKNAQIGFAFDADADRLAIVSEKGKPIGEELSLALAVKFILNKHRRGSPKKKIVITNLSTTKVIDDIVRDFGGTVIRTKIGEVHVAEELKKLKGLIGGEGNGGVIYPPVGFNRDGLTALALVLSLMARSGKKISELVSEIPSYYMTKTKIACKDHDQAEDFIKKVKEHFKGKDLILTDGVKAVLPSGWVHVRASNTEPVIRVIAEGGQKEEVENLVRQILEALDQA